MHFLQTIDRRIIYLALGVVLILALILGRPVDPIVLKSVNSLYDTIEQTPAGPDDHKIIIVSTLFSPSTLGESGNQARALLRHLMMRKKRFALLSVGEFQGAILGYSIAQEVAKQYNYTYGEDWISFGFQVNALAFYTGYPRDIPGVIKTDYLGKPITSYPIMEGITTVKDNVPLHIEITASDSLSYWIQYVQGRYGLKLGYATTGIMATEAYPLLDSGQIVGMLPGLKGAADYEKLVDDLETGMIARGALTKPFDPTLMTKPKLGTARRLMFTQGAAHLLIIVFIILGNIGLLLSRRRAARAAREDS